MASILFDGFFFFSVCLCRKYKYKNDSVHHFFTSRHKNPIPRDSGRQSGDREAAGRQAKPGQETPEKADRTCRSPVDRAGERRRTEPGTRADKGSPGDGEQDNARRAESDRTGFTDLPHEAERTKRRTTGQAGRETRARQDEKPGRSGTRNPDGQKERPGRGGTRNPGGAGRETRARRDEKPGRSGTRNPGGVEQETRAERDKKPGRSGTRNPGGHKKTDRNLQIAVRRFGSGSLTSRFSYRSALRNGS